MALKEYNENNIRTLELVSTTQKEEAFDTAVKGIKVVYINQELDGAFSSQLSSTDWNILKTSLETPKYNEKLAQLMNMESVFE